jgi:serine/threonine protein kinase/Flp pilus assembly protein TadD
MSKRSFFGLEPDQLGQLLSLGTEAQDRGQDPQQEAQARDGCGDAAEATSGDRSTQEAGARGNWATASVAGPEQARDRIGRYKLLRVLGEGGMGMVYLAEQEGEIKRKVALKVIKPGMDSKRVIARFEAEQQALALLDHPNVAHVYDAGTTEAGRPYFAMEYVKGLPITDYCDRHKLSIDERLRLFQQVCLAVHHAHQKGIIHRDLKPSNILVSAEGDRAIPKIIDFGVAKAMSQPLTERTLFTEDSHLLGTPEYMSPEQAEMVNEDIDIRSDIYSLGVLLYVLLAGILPYDSETFRQGGVEHIRKTIRETDPKTPSTRLTRLGEEAKKLAESRRTELAALARRLHTELEWIPLKAMRKDRAERYRSASELADDIENYLKGAPLIAGPPSTLYRLKKSARRHKALVGGVAAVLVVCVIGTIVSVTFALGQARARAEAQIIANFLTNDVLASVGKVKGHEATMADILGAASESLKDRFENQPLVEANICWRLSRIYTSLGDHRAAIPHLARVYQLRREHFGEQAHSTLLAKSYLALAYKNAGEYNEAERLFSELIAARRRSDPKNENVGLGAYFKGNLASVYILHGRYEEAERLFAEALGSRWWESRPRESRPYLVNLAETYLGQGRYQEAEPLFREAVEKKPREASSALGAVDAMHGLGCLCMAQGRYDEAEELFTKGMELGQRELPGKDHPATLRNVNGLAVLCTKQGRFDQAERLFTEVWEARKLKSGEDHPETLQIVNDFGVLRCQQQRYGEAESLLHHALKGRQQKLGPDCPACFESMHELGVLYLRQARYAEAERMLRDAFDGRQAKLGSEHPHTIDSLKQLVTLYESWSKPDEAGKWRAKLGEMKAAEK